MPDTCPDCGGVEDSVSLSMVPAVPNHRYLSRLRVLMTGHVEWVDSETGEVEVDLLSWKERWNLFGIHSYNWRWVRRWGEMDCGCTHNPLTRRRVLTAMRCPTHGFAHWSLEGWDDLKDVIDGY